jgi:integrase
MAILTRNNRFIIDYWPYGRRGKRIRLPLPESVTTVEEAKAIEQDLKRAARGSAEEMIPVTATVNDLYPEYLEWFSIHRAARTHEDVSNVFEKNISRILGKEKADDINIHHINLYKRMRLADKVGNRTISKELSYFSGFLRWCERNGYIKQRQFRIEALPYKRPVPIVLSFDEVIRIIDAAEPFYKAFLLCLYSLGFRRSEARFLKWEDIDYQNRLIRVKQKGGSYKVLPANRWLLSCLDAIKPENAKGYVFMSKRTGRPILNINRALARTCEKAGVRKHVNAHLFRHSIATHLMGKNINLRVIQQYLGHARLETTECSVSKESGQIMG